MKYLNTALILAGALSLTGCVLHYVQDAHELSDNKVIKATAKEYGLTPSQVQIRRVSNSAGLEYIAIMQEQEYQCYMQTYRAIGRPFLQHGTPTCKNAVGKIIQPFNR